MEFNDNNNEEEVEEKYSDEDYVEIYSKNAIFGFSIFSFLFATVLLVINLRAAGFKRAIGEVLVFFIGFYVASTFAMNAVISSMNIKLDPAKFTTSESIMNMPAETKIKFAMLFCASLAINIIGGLLLTQYFFKKYFPDNDYYPKPVAQPILIFILLIFVFVFLLR